MRKPYLAHLGDADGVRTFLVDGEWIRNYLDVDFTNGGHHFTRVYIPSFEVWVDREAPGAGELPFLVRHQLRERALMLTGVSYLRALALANRAERRERRAASNGAMGESPEMQRALVRRVQLGQLGAVEVWLVNGRGVRDLFDPNFTEGGHPLRYRFIPRQQIWIDDALVVRERDFVIAHEACELRLMERGMSYHDAHERALSLERAMRQERQRRPLPVLG